MERLQQMGTRWARSFPTVVAASYTCTYDGGRQRGPCNKVFTRQCDLSRHKRNHTKPSKCPKCKKGFPSPKDLERHDSCIHNHTIKYFCPHDWCRDSMRPSMENWLIYGFRRKDHWQKHMRQEHSATRDEVQTLQKQGIPMAELKEEKWLPALPKQSEIVVREVLQAEGERNDTGPQRNTSR